MLEDISGTMFQTALDLKADIGPRGVKQQKRLKCSHSEGAPICVNTASDILGLRLLAPAANCDAESTDEPVCETQDKRFRFRPRHAPGESKIESARFQRSADTHFLQGSCGRYVDLRLSGRHPCLLFPQGIM